MVAILILVHDERGDRHDQEGHLHIEAGQRIDAQGAAIPEPDTYAIGTTLPVNEAARPRTLAPGRTPTSGSPLRGTPVPRCRVLWVQSLGPLPFPREKENFR
ncbi:hypothetical protein F2Q68_00033947 [Brassica cretica]|uniref:Uncharacterized protein n=1 Tax=Brassica cretica TaxID=69181 RepID=A0A8S9H3K0_BRACR|nr:hypothetical protein F2Q68_00033947 [Brassica cretica]